MRKPALRERAPERAARRPARIRSVTESALVTAVRDGLTATPKTLPAALLYDDLGSALFEAITFLPEYELTRADLRLLETHAAHVAKALPGADVVELGPGAGRKATLFLERFGAGAPLDFFAVDVSPSALADCRRAVEALPGVTVHTHEARYLEGLAQVVAKRSTRPLLVLFLGSNLSNFERPHARAFLEDVHRLLSPGDGLLLATDLDKPVEHLLPAYDDAVGVTAAFDKNLLVRLNRELAADFDVGAFRHEARWDGRHRRVEMHLVATRAMDIHVRAAGLQVHFEAGESLWTESSHRFTTDELRGWASSAGFVTHAQWVDAQWAFAHSLFLVPKEPS